MDMFRRDELRHQRGLPHLPLSDHAHPDLPLVLHVLRLGTGPGRVEVGGRVRRPEEREVNLQMTTVLTPHLGVTHPLFSPLAL